MTILRCPKCKNILIRKDKSYQCQLSHSYDISKEGYVNLLMNKSLCGDNKEMVNARKDFLSKHFYDFVIDEIITLVKDNVTLIDCGCGEGYYTNYLKQKINASIYAFDISKDAILKASKLDKDHKIQFFVGSIYDIPVADKSCDYIINICAPLCGNEFTRILKDDGKIIKVIPATNHLIELKEFLYKDVYLNDETISGIEDFKVLKKIDVHQKANVQKIDLMNLFMMTPYYYKTKKEDVDRLKNLDELSITFAFEILIMEKDNV